MRRRLHHGSKPFKFEFVISDVTVHLNSASSIGVRVDNLAFSWQRGHRKVGGSKACVVERLDQQSNQLSRIAHLPADVLLPCTLFRHGAGAEDRWDSKLSELVLSDADLPPEEDDILCAVPFELSAHAASAAAPVHRARVDLQLGGDLGFMSFSICSTMLVGMTANEDGCSNAGSEVSDVVELAGWSHEDSATTHSVSSSVTSSVGHHVHASSSTGGADAPGTSSQAPRDGVEARWQAVYELERSRADALTIEALHRDLSALIRDKQRLSEENLKLRSTVSSIPQGKRELVERVAELEAEVRRLKREVVVTEERQATAFNAVMRGLEADVATLTAQRNEARILAASLERKASKRMSVNNLNLHAAASSSANGGSALDSKGHAHGVRCFRTPQNGTAASRGNEPDSSVSGDGKQRRGMVTSLRRTLSFEGKAKRRPVSEPKAAAPGVGAVE